MILNKYLSQLMLLPVLAGPLAALAAPAYTVAFAPPGFTVKPDWGGNPNYLNDRGQVVGNVDGVPVIWRGAGLTRIAALAGHVALGINNRGDIVGESVNGPFVNTKAGISYIPMDERWDYKVALAINDGGDVLAVGSAAEGIAAQTLLHTRRGTRNIGTLGGHFTYGNSLNKAGHVVGESQTGTDYNRHAILYKNGVLHDLGTLNGGEQSSARDINDAGQIVGDASTTVQDEYGPRPASHAFLYERGVMKSLGTLGGYDSYAKAINNAGVIVGGSEVRDDWRVRAFVYSRGKMTDLNERVDLPEGWRLGMANNINAKGQILAEACYFESCSYWVLLTPQRGLRSTSADGESELNESVDSTGEQQP